MLNAKVLVLAGLLFLYVGTSVGAYFKGKTDEKAIQTAKYVKDLEKEQIRYESLAERVAEEESKVMDMRLDYEERIDSFVGSVRTDRVRVYIKQSQTSMSKNESAKCGNDETRKFEVPPRILEASAELTRDYNRAVSQLISCQNYVKQNIKHVNNGK